MIAISRRSLAMFVLCLSLGGCSSWPSEGSGGMAELNLPPTACLSAMDARLRALESSKAYAAAPADLVEARLKLVRAQREYVGGLILDSHEHARVADALLTRLETKARSAALPTRAVAMTEDKCPLHAG